MWAAGSFSIKSGLQSAPVAYFMGMRFATATAILAVFCVATRRKWPQTWKGWGTHAAIGVLTNTVYMGLSALALRSISAGLASVAAGANGMFLALGATVVFGERLRKKDILGMGIALSCLSLVMYSRVGVDNSIIGIATVLLANSVMVASNLMFKNLKNDTDVASSQCIQLACGGSVLLMIAAMFEDWHQISWDANLFGCIGFLVATCSLGAMVIFLYLLRHASATVAGSYLFMVPIFGLVIGRFYAHEALSVLDVLGGLGVAGGVYLIQSPQRATTRRKWFPRMSKLAASTSDCWRTALPFSHRTISLDSH
jgi:drug/metabolite transporter (DMT)-like permease